MGVWDFILLACAIGLAAPLAVLAVECMVALLPIRPASIDRRDRPRIAAIVPAHNEAIGIARMIEALRPHLQHDDRLLVVADNCSDGTATIAAQLGTEVVERDEPERRGKGYAIAFGVERLANNPPEVVVIMDADCAVAEGSLADLARVAAQTGRPAQAIYLIDPPADASPSTLISAFAVIVKNLVRPRGLHALRQPCLLTGTGMALPWALLHQRPIPGGHIVEDMKLGIDLALDGVPPQLVPDVIVRSELPGSADASSSQRTRWEHGHLSTLMCEGPRLMLDCIVKRRMSSLALGLELCIPPLSLHLMLTIAAMLTFAIALIMGGSIAPLLTLASTALLAAIALGLGWYRFARETIPLRALLAAPFYMLSKIPLYLRFMLRPQREWVRTPRAMANPDETTSSKLDRSAQPKVLAISSGGGHWIELLRLRSAFDNCELVFVTVQRDYAQDVAGHRFRLINDATRWSKLALIRLACRILHIIVLERPDLVVTTGAAPGYFALRFGKWFGARTIWLDSIANVEELSMSGQMAGRYADLWLTQWSELAREDGPQFAGVVL